MRFTVLSFFGLVVGTPGLIRSGDLAEAKMSAKSCQIEVVDKSCGWPVPLVELRTTHNVRLVTDNAGVICFDLPELFGQETWFEVIGQGYQAPRDGFGYRGVRLIPQAGRVLKVELERVAIARRVGRLTGGGLYAESQKLGGQAPTAESGVLGCDSIQNAVHNGRLYWVWGDTTLARYPLGIFNASSATTSPKPLRAFVPPLSVQFEYFTDAKNQPRGVADIPGEGPTWLTGLVSLKDQHGESHLVAAYSKIKPPLDAYACGLAEWNESARRFESVRTLWTNQPAVPKPPPLPEGHAAFWTDAQGKPWVLFGNPFPTLRFAATYEAWKEPGGWEKLQPPETVASPTSEAIKPHSGSIAWHAWRKKWVTVFMQWFGKPSAFGELWYAEADSPLGPWGPAVKVLSHEAYTFYNPRLHTEFTPEDSPILLFEGTYTMQFSDAKQPTPRYDYNQILYRLDLDDPALAPAQRKGDPAPSQKN
jgi:hypothetical protein